MTVELKRRTPEQQVEYLQGEMLKMHWQLQQCRRFLRAMNGHWRAHGKFTISSKKWKPYADMVAALKRPRA